MKALVITALTGPDSLAIQEVAEPTLKSGQTMVRVAAGGLNFADFMTTKGGYPGTPAPPLVAGREFAGVEENSGRRVMGYMQWGAFANKAAAFTNLLWDIPEGWSSEHAAAFPVNYFTAYLAYWQAGMTQPRAGGGTHRVLIHAVAGGVGTAAVQIGKLLGVEMYGTSSSDEKLAKVKELGLDHGINYKRNEYEEVVRNLTRGEGVDAVFEMLGGDHTARSLRCLRDFGKVIQYGTASGKSPQLDIRALYAKSASIQGLWLTYLSQKPEIMEPAWKQLSQWAREGKLAPQIGHVFPMSQAVAAYKLLEQGKNYGKIVIKTAA
ncbi:MAG TPA: NADPH:quinone oxidoreductase family protein [Candidatus Sulfotelmatobacter sp.]|nr:NADPH:quinone oxidoreductase family protein [Candidatus Sulfotelmatobacter sp.]